LATLACLKDFKDTENVCGDRSDATTEPSELDEDAKAALLDTKSL